MAASKKQRCIAQPKENSSDSEEGNENEEDQEMEMIEVDFDVKLPEAADKQGIRNLLQQLFVKSNVNISELADLLIEQHNITGVIKEAETDDMDIDDMDVDFGVFSIVNLTKKKEKQCVKQIRSYLLNNCQEVANKETYEKFKSIIEDDYKHVGLIISERLVNIPAKIAVPLYAGLRNDLNKATERQEAYDFAYYLLISKVVTFNSGTDTENSVFLNPEEELIDEEADFSFEFELKANQDFGVSGGWTDEDDDESVPKRKILVLSASKWDSMYSKLVAELGPAPIT